MFSSKIGNKKLLIQLVIDEAYSDYFPLRPELSILWAALPLDQILRTTAHSGCALYSFYILTDCFLLFLFPVQFKGVGLNSNFYITSEEKRLKSILHV